MEKIKANKVWITVIVIGVVIIGILLLMLNQQKQATPAAQESSYSASVKASSSSQITQDQENVKLYAKKAAKMKGHVLNFGIHDVYYTSWSKQNFIDWAAKYNALSDTDKHNASTNLGTSKTTSNNSMDTRPLQTIADTITAGDFKELVGGGYYDTVKAFNKAYPAVNPDDIIK